jgi:hypothetical protein
MKVYLTTDPESRTSVDVFRGIAGPLVDHPHGWRNLRVVDTKSEADAIVTLSPNHVMAKRFGRRLLKDRLSLCNMKTREIWINEDRWQRAIPDESQLPLAAYRAYVLQHELGHALGLEHAEHCTAPGIPAPIMVQQTLGIGMCAPNPFPTQFELDEVSNKK